MLKRHKVLSSCCVFNDQSRLIDHKNIKTYLQFLPHSYQDFILFYFIFLVQRTRDKGTCFIRGKNAVTSCRFDFVLKKIDWFSECLKIKKTTAPNPKLTSMSDNLRSLNSDKTKEIANYHIQEAGTDKCFVCMLKKI